MRWGYGMGWRGLMVWWCLVSVFDGLSGGVVVWCVVELRVHEKCARIVVHISGPNQSAKGCFFWCRLVVFFGGGFDAHETLLFVALALFGVLFGPLFGALFGHTSFGRWCHKIGWPPTHKRVLEFF